jgi:putative membrane protein
MSSDEPKPTTREIEPPASEVAATNAGGVDSAAGSLQDSAQPTTVPVGASMHFLHWSSVLFDIIAHFRQFIVPIGFAFLGATNRDWFWGILATVFFGLSLLRTIFRYFTLQYGIYQGELIVKQGFFFRSLRTVPTRRIQNVDLRQNILHRLLGVYEVHVETASGQEAEAVLRVLTKDQVDTLRGQVFTSGSKGAASNFASVVSAVSPQADGVPAENLTPIEVHGEERVILKIPASWLATVGLTSNRGWIFVGVVVGLFYQFGSFESMDGKSMRKWFNYLLPLIPHDQTGYLYVAGLLIAGFVFLKLFGVVWYLVRFYNYRLTRCGEDLRVNCGLLTTYSATIPRGRIQLVSIQSSWLMRKFGMVRVCVETAGGGGESEENEQAATMRRSFIPALKESQVAELLSELRPGLEWGVQSAVWQGPAKGTFQRLLGRSLTLALLIPIGISIGYWPWGTLAFAVTIPFAIWRAWRVGKSLKYARTSFGVAFRSGLLTRKMSLTFFDRLQTLSLKQSPFDRRWKMATIAVDTAAAGPADHLIDIPFLEQDFAAAEFDALRHSAATHRPKWA